MAVALIALLCLSVAQRIAFTLACLFPPKPTPPGSGDHTIQVFVAARDEDAALPDSAEVSRPPGLSRLSTFVRVRERWING